MIKVIEIIVSPTGQSKVQTKGYTGSTCQQASKFIEQALGTRTGEQLTSEFYQVAGTQQVAQEGSQ